MRRLRWDVRRLRWMLAAVLALGALLPAQAVAGQDASLRAGVGRADITPPTGYFLMGWVQSDAQSAGQHTRLFARSVVLERGGRKLALVAADLAFVDQGLVREVAAQLAGRGFTERNILVSASHTHGAYDWTNIAFMTKSRPTTFNLSPDPQLFSFEARRIALAVARADDDLGRAALGWGRTELLGVTRNRSLEAHLANHGIERFYGTGKVSEDPGGYEHTIDPGVDVMRVDRVARGGRRLPIGMWSTFSAHGTVNKGTFTVYNADHQGSAARVVEAALRRSGRVPRGQEVVNAFGNADEGDVSAGLDRGGPAYAEEVGRREAAAMLEAWRRAGRRMSARPELDWRWTRICFCGQRTEGGQVDDRPVVGLPFFTGSEEGRGPLYEATGMHYEGVRSPAGSGPQGRKVGADTGPVSVFGSGNTTPLVAVRIADRLLVTVPGEMTAEMGRRVRASALAATASRGIRSVVLSGLVNDYKSYFTTPEEYDMQHYEGGQTLYGRVSSNLLKAGLTDLAARLVRGEPAPEPSALDRAAPATDETDFGAGAETGTVLAEPQRTERLGRAAFRWQGGPRGLDRPLDAPFVEVQRRADGRWRTVDSDLGLRILWRVDDEGAYTAWWEAPRSAPAGTYRFVVTANRYRLESAPFGLEPFRALTVERDRDGGEAGRPALRLAYPEAVENRDFTYRPRFARRGIVRAIVDGRRMTLRPDRRGRFTVPPGAGRMEIPAGAARDAYGNTNGQAVTLAE